MNKTLTHRKRAVLLTLLLLIGLLAVPVMLTWRQVRQERLNRSFLLAVRRNDTRAVLALLAQRANPDERELPSYTRSFWLTLLERLRGYQPKKDQFPTALLVALYWRRNALGAVVVPPPHNFALVKALVDSGANVNVSDVSGATPLILAASRGQRDVVRYLVEQGANVNARDKAGNTPLSCVAAWHDLMPDDTAIVNSLLDRGADINGAYYLGTTPLIFALQAGNPSTVRLLVARHADVNRKDSRGVSALSLAQNSSDKEVLKLLKQAGAK
jgi:hypothetical protein